GCIRKQEHFAIGRPQWALGTAPETHPPAAGPELPRRSGQARPALPQLGGKIAGPGPRTGAPSRPVGWGGRNSERRAPAGKRFSGRGETGRLARTQGGREPQRGSMPVRSTDEDSRPTRTTPVSPRPAPRHPAKGRGRKDGKRRAAALRASRATGEVSEWDSAAIHGEQNGAAAFRFLSISFSIPDSIPGSIPSFGAGGARAPLHSGGIGRRPQPRAGFGHAPV